MASDSEAAFGNVRFKNHHGYYQMASSLPDNYKHPNTALNDLVDGMNTDDDGQLDGAGNSYHDFAENQTYGNRVVKTGRQRKKLAARSKGGEFQTKRKKRRVYFCCISSEIDVEKLLDYLHGAEDLLFDWKFELHNDVLHLYKPGVEDISATKLSGLAKEEDLEHASTPKMHQLDTRNPIHEAGQEGISLDAYLLSKMSGDLTRQDSASHLLDKPPHSLSGIGAKEVFVFDFGAAVFWGFPRGEEVGLLKTIRMFVTKGMVGSKEFQSGEDDMAFVIVPEDKTITIANDVISLPEDTLSKQRLAVSFAIAQSSVLAIFEARIEQKVEEYKYIPETLAALGKVQLSERQLGMMIGEVFVIRHDVNLHTEILGESSSSIARPHIFLTTPSDTPDFFWKEKNFEADYKMVSSYLEMSGRTEILNKRLDMLRELLDVLQQQMENAHAVKLEWIVIYLIVAEVVLQGLAIICNNLL